MIDFVKIHLFNIDISNLLNNESLEFVSVVSEKTGELSRSKLADYHFCKIVIYESGLVVFKGSIHKMYNSLKGIEAPNKYASKKYKGFNGNQFTLSNIIEVRKHLQEMFRCSSRQMILKNIEVGVNLNIEFSPKKYIDGLLYHKGKMFEYRYHGNLAQSEHQRFIFKIYNKSNQYKMESSTIRIELKILKEIEFKKIGLSSFQDVNGYTLDEAKRLLLERFDEVVHYDCTIRKKLLSKKQKELLKCYSNPRFWMNDIKPNYRFRHKELLKKITLKNSNNLHQELRYKIIQKCSIINRESETPLVA